MITETFISENSFERNVFYPKGKRIPINVLGVLIYLSKVGLMTTSQWLKFFATGNTRWSQRQLKFLADNRLIKRHLSAREGKWVLDRYGKTVLEKLEIEAVEPVTPQMFLHDEFIGESLLQLERMGICKSWLTEKQLKIQRAKDFIIRGPDQEVKYPDAILIVEMYSKKRIIALEYERTGKTSSRYRSILWQYKGLNSIDLVMFIYEDEAVKNRIQKALSFVGCPDLQAKVAFVKAKDWRRDPSIAQFNVSGRTYSLFNLCSRHDVDGRDSDHLTG